MQAFSAVTMRVLQITAASAVSSRGYVATRPCAQVIWDGVVPLSVIESIWPACAPYISGVNLDQSVVVRADYNGLPAEVNVALSIVSGFCALIALGLHTLAVEVYVSLRLSALD